MPYQRILVALDGSRTSMDALDRALDLAKIAGARVKLLACIDELSMVSAFEDSAFVMATAREEARKALEQGEAAARAAGVACETQVAETPGKRLGQAVAELAAAWEADLIVVGTHGRRGLGRMLLGSGAESIIRLATRPVMVVRGSKDD